MNAKARLRAAMVAIDGVIESPSAFKDDLGYWVNGTEIAHFAADEIEIRLTRTVISARRRELERDSRVVRRAKSSDWIVVTRLARSDEAFTLRLVRLAAAAHRTPEGIAPRLPPVGGELERRRRFHSARSRSSRSAWA